MSSTTSSTSSKITLKEYLAKCVAEIRRKEETKRRKMIKREIKLEKERQKKLEEAERLAEEEARAEEALCPPLPRIGSRYPMNHLLKISYWPDPAPASKAPVSLASSYPPPTITSATVAATTVSSPAARSATKKQMSARKKLHIDMVMDESPLPTKRGRNVVNYFEE